MRGTAIRLAIGLAVLLLAACGGSSPSAPSGGGATITITASGVSPNPITISPGGRVLFVNNDTRNHDMEWDPHPDHQGPCTLAGVNQPGFLSPGQSRETGNFVNVQSCGYHDHSNPPNEGGSRWAGTITVR